MDVINIIDNRGKKRQMEVVATFKIDGYSNSYVVYKEL